MGAVLSTAPPMLMPNPMGALGLVGDGVEGIARPKPGKLGVEAFFMLKKDFFSESLPEPRAEGLGVWGHEIEGEDEAVEVGEMPTDLVASNEDRRSRSSRRFFWLENPKTTSIGSRG